MLELSFSDSRVNLVVCETDIVPILTFNIIYKLNVSYVLLCHRCRMFENKYI